MTDYQLSTTNYQTHSAEETFELAYKIGEAINAPTVFLLQGDLGAGKTVFAKGIAAGLDIDPADVSSPTFTLINQHEGRMRLYHLDLYRIEGGPEGSSAELFELGLEEMLSEQNAVVLIEWPERLGAFAIPNACRVVISDSGGDERRLTIQQSSAEN
jgi:tRNA threonylcarbamoyladenosine biosynthesis protein TsaE